MAARSRASKRVAGEGAADERRVALRQPEGVADVAGAVAAHVAGLGVRELATLPQPHVELGYDERIPDVDDPVPVHIAAGDLGDRGGGGRAARRRGEKRD